jgi:hypothetical protein
MISLSKLKKKSHLRPAVVSFETTRGIARSFSAVLIVFIVEGEASVLWLLFSRSSRGSMQSASSPDGDVEDTV